MPNKIKYCDKYSSLSAGKPIPGATWSKAWACGRWLAEIVGSNLAGGMDVYLLRVLFVIQGSHTECGV